VIDVRGGRVEHRQEQRTAEIRSPPSFASRACIISGGPAGSAQACHKDDIATNRCESFVLTRLTSDHDRRCSPSNAAGRPVECEHAAIAFGLNDKAVPYRGMTDM
jgi:hypothetical protein